VIFIGTPNGLFTKGSFSAPAEREKHVVLSQSNITAFAGIGKEHVLISTNAQGLYLYDVENNSAQHLDRSRMITSTGFIAKMTACSGWPLTRAHNGSRSIRN